MSTRITIALALATVASLTAAAQEERGPRSGATVGSVAGQYEYRDRELIGHLDLRGDQSFEYKVDGIGTPVESEARFHFLARGVWRFTDRGLIALTNAPTTPPVFRQVSAVRDPKVRAAFSIVATNGTSVEDLGVRTNDGESGQLNMLSGDDWTVPLLQQWDTDEGRKSTPTPLPRNFEIVRSSDNRSLVKVALVKGGPNRFAFSYTPSPIEPFELAAGPVAGEPGLMEVEFGTASMKMRRVSPN